MRRLPDWEARLASYVIAHMGSSFRYGRLDCALFAAGAVKAMTGSDLSDGWDYGSLRAGLEMLREKGFVDHVELTASLLQEVSPAMAHRGDVAVVEVDGGTGFALGIFQGERIYALTPRDGVGLMSRFAAVRAFHVPFPDRDAPTLQLPYYPDEARP